MQGDWRREKMDALNISLWSFFPERISHGVGFAKSRGSDFATLRFGCIMELARIDTLHGTEDDDPGNWWWERASSFAGMKSVSALRCAP